MDTSSEVKLFRHYMTVFFNENHNGLHLYQLEDFNDDNSLRLVATNEIAEKITGLKSEIIVGKKILENFPNLKEQDIPHKYAEAVRSKKIVDLGEISYNDERFPLRYYEVKAFPHIFNHLAVVFNDVTEKRYSERKIQMVEKEYKELINSGSILIWSSNEKGKILFLNNYWTNYTGESIKKLEEDGLDKYIHPDDISSRKKSFNNGLKNKEKFKCYFRLKDFKGNYKWIYEEVNPRFNENKKITGFVGHCIDINERKLFEEALLNEKKLLRTLIDNLPDAIFIKDLEGRKIISNLADVNNLGFKNEEDVLGKTDLELLLPEFAEKCYNDDMQVIRKGKSIINREEKIANEDGSIKWLRTTKIPFTGANGNISGLIGIAHDISKRKEMENALKESEIKYKRIFEFHSAVKLFIDCETNQIIDANRSAIRFYGYPKKKLLQMNYSEIIDNSAKQHRDTLLEGAEHHTETRHILSDKSLKDVEIYSGKIKVLDKMYMHLIVHDITDRKILESQLVQAQKLESIGQLAAGIAHEINTPTQYVGDNICFLQDAFGTILNLNSLLSKTLQTLKSKPECKAQYNELLDELTSLDLDFLITEIPEAIKQSKEGIDRITKIVKAMKGFSHPVLENKVVSNINDLIENTVVISRNEWKYHSEMETDYTDEPCNIYCYPNELSQVILNLIVNSAHAIEEKYSNAESLSGKITIVTKAMEKSVVITISDNGAGIPDKVKKLVFNHFFTTKPVGKGTGQGLAIAYDIIVKKHNGKIDFNSKEGEGTTFTISLPYE